MPLKVYNTLTRKKEIFKPLDKKEVRFYSCGPTVYNYPHIGNYRAYIFADTLKRVLLYEGYKVKHIMNLTDIDDKTIRDSMKAGKSLKEFTEYYSEEFFKDIESLNILPPAKFTKATDYIKEMVKMVEALLKKGYAYKSEDGSVYFDIKKFKDYGKLSKIVTKNQKQNASGRIKSDEYEKGDASDFALWKAWDENDGDVYWETSLGKGRPGWHIECSAMAIKTLGKQLDIHTGGVDNIFPHHENEIAQSECATGEKFVKYWMHNEWVLVDNKKMAKSFNNFYTLRDLDKEKIDPLAYRLWLLGGHYRKKINFVWDTLLGTEKALRKLREAYIGLGDKSGIPDKGYQNKFESFIEDDLDTPKVLALMWKLLSDKKIDNKTKKATVLLFDKVLGLGLHKLKKEEIPTSVMALLEERKKARDEKDFAKSDKLRDSIKALGYEVLDTKEGQKVSKI